MKNGKFRYDDLFRLFPDLPWPQMANRPFAEQAREVERNIAKVRHSVASRQIAFHQSRPNIRQRLPRQTPANRNDDAFRRIGEVAQLHYGRLSLRQQRLGIGRALKTIAEIAATSIRGVGQK